MALVRIEGFDHQDTSTDLVAEVGKFVWRTAINVTFTAYGSGLNNIGKAIEFGSSGSLTGVLSTALTTAFFGSYILIPTSAVANKFNIAVWNSVTQNPTIADPTGQISLVFNSANGSISAYRNIFGGFGASPTLLFTTSNNTFPNNSAFFCEVGFTISPTVGALNVAINGASVISLTGINNSQDGGVIFDSILYGSTYEGDASSCLIDHFYFLDSTTGPGTYPLNGFIGPVNVYTLFPNGAGSSTQYTPLSGANYTQVEETAMDSDTTYNSSDTIGNKDLFTIQPLPTGSTPIAAQVTGAYRQDSGGTRAVASHLKSGTTDVAGTNTTLQTTYTYQHDVYPQDPNAGPGAWTVTTINNAQIGYATTN